MYRNSFTRLKAIPIRAFRCKKAKTSLSDVSIYSAFPGLVSLWGLVEMEKGWATFFFGKYCYSHYILARQTCRRTGSYRVQDEQLCHQAGARKPDLTTYKWYCTFLYLIGMCIHKFWGMGVGLLPWDVTTFVAKASIELRSTIHLSESEAYFFLGNMIHKLLDVVRADYLRYRFIE